MKILVFWADFHSQVCSQGQGWGEYYSGTRLVQNSKHEYTKNIVLEYYSSTDFPVLVLVCSVLAPALPKGQIDNVPALFQIMACHQTGDKPLSEPMMA